MMSGVLSLSTNEANDSLGTKAPFPGIHLLLVEVEI